MPNPMGNSRRGPDDLDRALDNLVEPDPMSDNEQDDYYASIEASGGGGPVLGEGDNVGAWTSDEETEDEAENALDAARPEDVIESGDIIDEESLYDDEGFDGGGYQTAAPRPQSR
jgi:hypothetical protein